MTEVLYTTGGTVQAQEGGLYLSRPADEQLLALCQESRFAYVLTPRQLGKSSLMIRTAEQLLDQGFRAVMVDLTQIGTGSDAEQWYGDVLEVVADQLELTTDARSWWKQEAETGLTLRLTRFFEEVVLAEVSEPIVIFVDEIDTTLSLAFTDDFFAAIRYFYVARAQNPQLRRLSFVLIGVATPADLIRDPRRTPFNIGERVDLRDFSLEEARPLAAGLPLPPPEAERALGWILGWTGGHPYLSQRLCSVLAADPPAQWSEAAVDQAVGRTFFGERSEQDNNLQFVRDMLTKRAPDGYGAELLRTYRSIWQGRQPVADEEQNLVHAHLKLAGVVRRDGRQLLVRNRLYREVFNAAWIEEHSPEDFWKRYGPVLKWAVPVSVSAVLVAGVMTALALEARRQTELAERAQRRALVQESLATRQAQRAQQAEARAKASASKALARERDTQRALLQLRQSQQKERLALTSTEQQRQRAEQEAVVARQERSRAEQQTLLARAQTALANLRAQVARALNLLPTAEAAPGLVLALDAWSRKTSALGIESESVYTLLQALQSSPEKNVLIGHTAGVKTTVFSPDGRIIASGSWDGMVRLWDARSGAPISPPLKGHAGEVESVAFSSDGNLIASASTDRTVRLWDAKRGVAIGAPLKGHDAEVWAVTFSPDHHILASAGVDGTIRLWDSKSQTPIRSPLKGHDGSVTSLAFRPDGQLIASAGVDGTIRLWSTKTGAPIGSPLQGHKAGVWSIAFSPDGRLLVSGSWDRTVRLWDAKTGAPIGSPLQGHEGGVMSVAFSPDGRQIASGGMDRVIKLWDVIRGESIGKPLRGHQRWVNSIAFSPDGRQIVSGGQDTTVRLWDVSPGAAIIPPLRGHQGSVRSVTFSSDGSLIASAGWEDRTVRIWDAKSGHEIGQILRGHEGGVTSVAFSRNGSMIASGGADQTVRLWDAKRYQAIGAPLKGHKGQVWAVALSPQGRIAASGGSDGRLIIWDIKERRMIREFASQKHHEGGVFAVAFSPDGRLLASAGVDGAVLWDVNTYKPISGIAGIFRAVAFSPAGGLIAVGGEDLIIASRLNHGAPSIRKLRDQAAFILSIAFSPDGRRIVSGGQDGSVLLRIAGMDSLTLPPFAGPIGSVSAVAFSPDGKSIASAGEDGLVRLFAATPSDWFRLGCARLAHHPILRNPSSVVFGDLVAAGKRVHQACQAAGRSGSLVQQQGPGQVLHKLVAWGRRLLGG